jgi:hypothetical protein
VWAIRHFAIPAPALDPTTPLAPGNLWTTPDARAVGAAVNLTAGPPARVVALYYSRNPDAMALMRKAWGEAGFAAALEAGPRGSVRMTFSPEAEAEWMLFSLLGHMVFI